MAEAKGKSLCHEIMGLEKWCLWNNSAVFSFNAHFEGWPQFWEKRKKIGLSCMTSADSYGIGLMPCWKL